MEDFENLTAALQDNAGTITFVTVIVIVLGVIAWNWFRSGIALKAIASYEKDQILQKQEVIQEN